MKHLNVLFLGLVVYVGLYSPDSSAGTLVCREQNRMSVTYFENFDIVKVESEESGEHIYVVQLSGENSSFSTIACDLGSPIDQLVNIAIHSNNWDGVTIQGTSSGGMETTLLFNPKDGSAVVSNIYGANTEIKGWGISYQSICRCKVEPVKKLLSLCENGPNKYSQ